MTFEHVEASWLDERGTLTVVELTQCSGLTAEEVRELCELGVLTACPDAAEEWRFPPSCIAAARTAARLRRDFELDTPGLALVLTLLERIQTLESELAGVRAQLPRRIRL